MSGRWKSKRILESFLDARMWSHEVTLGDFDGVAETYDFNSTPTVAVTQPHSAGFKLPYRLFNLFTLTVYDYTCVLEFLGNYCDESNFRDAHTDMGIEDWRAIGIETVIENAPIIRKATLDTVATLWKTVGKMDVSNPTRYVDAYESIVRRNVHRIPTLEVTPIQPGNETVYNGVGEPFRLVAE